MEGAGTEVGGGDETTDDLGRLRDREETMDSGARWLCGVCLELLSPHSLYLARNSTLS